MQLRYSQRQRSQPESDQLQTQEMSLNDLELALKVVQRMNHRQNLMEPLLIPSELEHLNPLDWEIVNSLLGALEQEKEQSRLH